MSGPEISFRALIVPVTLIAVAALLRASGLDYQITDICFDALAKVFPLRSNEAVELIGHRLARNFATLIWFCLVGGAIASSRVDGLRPYGAILWLTAGAMALGPILVVILKEFTSFPCPWNLQRYGGLVAEPARWFVTPANAGKCFPSGHSAGGFSFLAFYFAGQAMQSRRLAAVALVFSVIAGCAFSAVRVVQGAHFVSHALWSAAIDWLMAALVFLPVMSGRWPLRIFEGRAARHRGTGCP